MRVAWAASMCLLGLAAGCRVSAEAKGSASMKGAEAEGNAWSGEGAAPPPAASTAATEAAPAPAPAPTAEAAPACPVVCYVASGASRVAVTGEEQAQLTSALGPAFARMRSCAGGAPVGRHRSPILNLRIAPDGKLADLGVDPHHGWSEACMDAAARDGAVQVSLPGRTTVRCIEQCAAPAPPPPAAPRARKGR